MVDHAGTFGVDTAATEGRGLGAMGTVKSPLTEDVRRPTGEALQGCLIDLVELSLQAKQAHWNLFGQHFRPLHLQLDEVVAMARDHMDSVAERAIAVGVNPDGRPRTVAEWARGPQLEAGYIADDKVVLSFTDILAQMIQRFRERIDQTQADLVTQDLIIEITRDLEKQHWMFEVQR
jgi:starvation-inducible DNA-binding protein